MGVHIEHKQILTITIDKQLLIIYSEITQYWKEQLIKW